MNSFKAMTSACIVIGLLAGTANAVNIETVPVGDPGNMADDTGFGSVGYSYNIGKYEVTAGQYTEFLNKVGGIDVRGLYNTNMSRTDYGSGIMRSGEGTINNPYTYSVALEFVNRPVNCVSFWDSCRFANWLSNGQPTGMQDASTTETGTYTLNGYNGMDGRSISRNANWKWAVVSEDEWYKAAYYKEGSTNAGYWDYPTRGNTAPGRDMTDMSGNNTNYYDGNGPYPIDSDIYTTLVGEFQNSASPYGTFDQGGNVAEWNESVMQGCLRGYRGGSYDRGSASLLPTDRHNGFPSSEFVQLGFRIVYVPEPATIVMLALAGMGIVRRRRA